MPKSSVMRWNSPSTRMEIFFSSGEWVSKEGAVGKRLEGQVAWVSGSTKGIGKGVVELFAEEGAAVVVLGRNSDDGRSVRDHIVGKGGRALFVQCDMTDPEQIRDSIDKTVKEYGKLNILVNNAGNILIKMLHETSEKDWDDLMALNVKSMFIAFKHAFEHLSKHERSYVVNIGSINSFIGNDRVPVYTASKGAVLQLSRSIGLDYARFGIRCNCICPGITYTPLLQYHMGQDGDADENIRKRVRRVPLGKALSIEDVAKSVLFFSCEDSAGITATSLVVDGGLLGAAEWDTEQAGH